MTDRLELEVYPSDGEAFEATAEAAAEWLRGAIAARGVAHMALAGGRGGRGVMAALGACATIPWDRVHCWLGDERCVSATDPQSNQRLARETLFAPRGLVAARIHVPPLGGGDPEGIAHGYAGMLRALLGDEPVFDLVLLGMGPDGHVASLMPGCLALGAKSPVAVVSAEEVTSEPRVARITLTPPVLERARRIMVTVTGGEKAERLREVLRGPSRVPATLVRPGERVSWVVDRAAASGLLRDAMPPGA